MTGMDPHTHDAPAPAHRRRAPSVRRRALVVALAIPAVAAGTRAATTAPASTSAPSRLLVEVPDPMSGDNPLVRLTPSPLPAPGATVAEPRLATSATRVTAGLGVRHEYSRFDPFNRDGSLVLLTDIGKGEQRVYRTSSVPYDTARNLVRAVDLAEARWDRSDAAALWGLDGLTIVRLDVRKGTRTVVKDFRTDRVVGPILRAEKDIYRVTMKDEGEASRDRRYWALALQGSADDYRLRYVVTWDRVRDEVLGTLKLTARQTETDWVGMSPLGNWVLIGGQATDDPPVRGLTIADRALRRFHAIDVATAHADVGVDSDGREVIVMQNSRNDIVDLIPLDWSTKPILAASDDYAGTNRVPLVRLFYASESPNGFNGGVHISANHDGWAVISTTAPKGTREKNWLERSIVLVRLDRRHPRAWYLAKVHGDTEAYWEETQATMSDDGARVVWATNWGRDVGAEKVFVVQLRMPQGWQRRLLSA